MANDSGSNKGLGIRLPWSAQGRLLILERWTSILFAVQIDIRVRIRQRSAKSPVGQT